MQSVAMSFSSAMPLNSIKPTEGCDDRANTTPFSEWHHVTTGNLPGAQNIPSGITSLSLILTGTINQDGMYDGNTL